MSKDTKRPFGTFDPPMMFTNETCTCEHCKAVRTILKQVSFRTDHDVIYRHLKRIAYGLKQQIDPDNRYLSLSTPPHQSAEDLYSELMQLAEIVHHNMQDHERSIEDLIV